MSKRKSEYFKDGRQAQALSRKLTTAHLCVKYDKSDTTIRRWTHDPRIDFPQPFQVTPGGVNFWDAAEIDEFDRRRRELAPGIYAQTSARRKAEIAARKLKKASESSLIAASDTGDDAAAAVPADRHVSAPHEPPARRSS